MKGSFDDPGLGPFVAARGQVLSIDTRDFLDG